MQYKRLIATVCLQGSQAVKSYGYSNRSPLSSLSTLLLNLENWCVDEIILINLNSSLVNTLLLKSVSQLNLRTPLTYAGGIRNLSDVSLIMNSGFERIVLEHLLLFPDIVKEIVDVYGQQSVIASLPFRVSPQGTISMGDNFMENYNVHMELVSKLPVSEFLIIDANNEGYAGNICIKSVETIYSYLSNDSRNILVYGGLDIKSASHFLSKDKVDGVCFGNVLNDSELSAFKFRQMINQSFLYPVLREVSIQ